MGVLLVVAFAVLAIAVYFLNPRSIAESLAATVKTETGRELSFDSVEVKLLPRPSLVLTEVRFGNAAWGSRPLLARVGRATVDIDVPAIFSGLLRAKNIEVSDANVYLETAPDGVGNWVMGSTGEAKPAWLEKIEIDEIKLQALAFTYRDGKTGKTKSVQIDSTLINAPSASRPIHFSIHATFEGKSVEATGTFGAVSELIANASAYPVDLDAKIGAASVNVHGTLDTSMNVETKGRLKLALRAETPELTELTALFGASVPPLGPLRGTAQLTGTADAPGLSAIDITAGGRVTPEIRLRGTVANLRAASGIDLKVTAEATDWWHFGKKEEGSQLPPFRASVRLSDVQQGYHLDNLEVKIADSTLDASLQVMQVNSRFRITGMVTTPLIDLAIFKSPTGNAKTSAVAAGTRNKYELWKIADADLDLSIGKLIFPDGHQVRSGSGRVALDNGKLKVDALQATLGGAVVSLDGSIADPQVLGGMNLKLALHGSELAELFKFFGTSIPPVGPYHGKAQMQGSLDVLRLMEIDATAGRHGQSLRARGRIENTLHWQGVQLALAANISDSTAAGSLFSVNLPHLPVLRATARVTGPQGGYVFDNLKLKLGQSSMQGRVVYKPSTPRPLVKTDLSGSRVDLSELPTVPAKPNGSNPLLVADVDADINFGQVVLPNRRALGPVNGKVRLAHGTVELKQFNVAVAGASAILQGSIRDPLTLAGLELMIYANFIHRAGLAALTGQNYPDLPPFTVSGKLTDVSNGYAVSDLKIAYAATKIDGDVVVTRGANRYKVNLKADSPLLDATAFTRLDAANSAAKPVPAGTHLIPDIPIPIEILNDIDADLDLRFDTVKFSDTAPLGPLHVRAVIANGRLKAEPIELAIKAGQILSASGTVDAALSAWSLRIEGTNLDLGEMLKRFGRPKLVTGGSTDLILQFEASGKSMAAVLGSINGEAQMKVGPYRVNNIGTDLGAGIVMQIVGMVNPFRKTDPYTDGQCFAARVPIKDGVIVSNRNVAVETTKYNAVLSGTVNLRSEEIDIAAIPIVKSGFGIGTGEITGIVRLRGTLAAPSLGVDPVGAAKSAASFGAAYVTLGGWWIADALINKATADPRPCVTALGK